MKNILILTASLILILMFVFFVLELLNLGWIGFFKPKYQNVERKVFENTKSYTHGKIQDLAKYYKEYNNTNNMNDKQVIENVIRIRFAEFDADNISSNKLRSFLIDIRGY